MKIIYFNQKLNIYSWHLTHCTGELVRIDSRAIPHRMLNIYLYSDFYFNNCCLSPLSLSLLFPALWYRLYAITYFKDIFAHCHVSWESVGCSTFSSSSSTCQCLSISLVSYCSCCCCFSVFRSRSMRAKI